MDARTYEELHRRLADIRKSLQETRVSVTGRYAMEICEHLLDTWTLDGSLEVDVFVDEQARLYDGPSYLSIPLRYAERLLRSIETHVQRTSQRHVWDATCEFLWIPLPDRTCGLLLLYAQDTAYADTLLAQDGVVEYSYWDHSDADPRVSEQEWNQRRQDWLEVLPPGKAPIDVGYGCTISFPAPLSPSDVARHARPLQKRTKKRVQQSIFDREQGYRQPQSNEEALQMNWNVASVVRFSEREQQGQFEEQYQVEWERLSRFVPTSYDVSYLTQSIKSK